MQKRNLNAGTEPSFDNLSEITVDHDKMDLIVSLRSVRMEIRQKLGASLMRFVENNPFLQKCRAKIAEIIKEHKMLYDRLPLMDEQFRTLKCEAVLEVSSMPGVREQLQPLFEKQNDIKHELRTKHNWKMPRPFDG